MLLPGLINSILRCKWLHDFNTFSSVLSLQTLYIFLNIFNTLSYCKCSSKVRSTSDNNHFCVALYHRLQMNLSLETSLRYAMKAQFVESMQLCTLLQPQLLTDSNDEMKTLSYINSLGSNCFFNPDTNLLYISCGFVGDKISCKMS